MVSSVAIQHCNSGIVHHSPPNACTGIWFHDSSFWEYRLWYLECRHGVDTCIVSTNHIPCPPAYMFGFHKRNFWETVSSVAITRCDSEIVHLVVHTSIGLYSGNSSYCIWNSDMVLSLASSNHRVDLPWMVSKMFRYRYPQKEFHPTLQTQPVSSVLSSLLEPTSLSNRFLLRSGEPWKRTGSPSCVPREAA